MKEYNKSDTERNRRKKRKEKRVIGRKNKKLKEKDRSGKRE